MKVALLRCLACREPGDINPTLPAVALPRGDFGGEQHLEPPLLVEAIRRPPGQARERLTAQRAAQDGISGSRRPAAFPVSRPFIPNADRARLIAKASCARRTSPKRIAVAASA